MTYLLRRLGFYLLAAWVSLTVNFVIPRLAPGDPASALQLRFQGRLEPEALLAMKQAFGFVEAPLPVQYASYLAALLRGDLGISVSYFPAPVRDVIAEGLGWTVFLSGVSVLTSFALGSLLGAVLAFRRGGLMDSVLPPVLTFLGAFPYFWLSMLLLYVLGFSLDWLPVRHAYADHLEPGLSLAFVSSALLHAFLPALSIVLTSVGSWVLSMRSNLIATLSEDYVLLAAAKGLSPRRIVFRYAVRSALLPSLAGFGMALGFVLSGSLLAEIVFSYPGQGYLLYQAVKNQDYALLQGLFLSITLAVLLANFLVDVLSFVLDPRLRG